VQDAVIVRTRKKCAGATGTYIRFDQNAAVLIQRRRDADRHFAFLVRSRASCATRINMKIVHWRRRSSDCESQEAEPQAVRKNSILYQEIGR